MEHIRESLQKVTNLTQKDLKKDFEINAKNMRILHLKESMKRVFLSFRQGPEIFNLLVMYLKTNRLKLCIPDSLVYLPAYAYPAFLSTTADGFVEMNLSKSSIDLFFEKCEHGILEQPKFIHIAMNQRIKLCYSKAEARKAFEDCPHFTHRLHRWIPFTYQHASKLRVHWKLSKPPSAYILTNKLQSSPKFHSKSKSSLPSIKPLKNQEKPILKHKNALNTENFKFIGDSQSIEMKKFLVQFSSSSNLNITQTTRYMQELQETFNSLVKLMHSVYFRNPNKLQELLLDFLKSGNKWVLISCKGHKIKGDQEVTSLRKVEIERSFNNSMMRGPSAMAFESVTEESLKSDESFDSFEEENEEIERTAKRIEYMAIEMQRKHGKIEGLNTQSYLDLRQSDNLGRIPYIMIGLLPHKIENPLSYFIEKDNRPPIKQNNLKYKTKELSVLGNKKNKQDTYGKITSKCLSNIAKVYNKHRQEALIGRKNLLDKNILEKIFNESEKELQDILKLVFTKKKLNFSHYFEHKTDEHLNFICKNMLDCFVIPNEYAVKKKVRSIHSNLNISEAEFEECLNEFEGNVRAKDILSNDEVKALVDKFISFKNDVVSD